MLKIKYKNENGEMSELEVGDLGELNMLMTSNSVDIPMYDYEVLGIEVSGEVTVGDLIV